MLLKADGQC